MTKRVALAGARGRLGSVIADVVRNTDGFELVLELGSADAPDGIREADLLVDATTIHASKALVSIAIEAGIPTLIATSGWDAAALADLDEHLRQRGADAPGVIVVPNFSLGSVLGSRLAATVAKFFAAVEIIEAHHDRKMDSPSGTAVRTAELLSQTRKQAGLPPFEAPFADQEARGQVRDGIPLHSLRLPGVVARQQVIFGGTGETLTIDHLTMSADSYRDGIALALKALPTSHGLTVGLDSLLGLDS